MTAERVRRAYRVLDMLWPPPCGRRRRLRFTDKIDGGQSLGITTRGAKIFTIQLDRVMCERSPGSAILVLVHEMAHTMAWDEDIPHGPLFGEAQALIWSSLVGEDTTWSDNF